MMPHTDRAGPLDADGVALVVGARVVQIRAFDSGRGALEMNCGKIGTIQKLGRTRARVAFDDTYKMVAFRLTDEPNAHSVHGAYLRVVPDGATPDVSVPRSRDWWRRTLGNNTGQ
jgi:hypothetical protein